jgi:hypothetical protein
MYGISAASFPVYPAHRERSRWFYSQLVDDHIAFDACLAGESKARVVHGTWSALPDKVLPLISPHRADPPESRHDFHCAVRAFTDQVTPNRPVVTACGDSFNNRVPAGRFYFNAKRFDTNS